MPICYFPGEELIFGTTAFTGVDGIGCFATEISSATQNWLNISDGQGYMAL